MIHETIRTLPTHVDMKSCINNSTEWRAIRCRRHKTNIHRPHKATTYYYRVVIRRCEVHLNCSICIFVCKYRAVFGRKLNVLSVTSVDDNNYQLYRCRLTQVARGCMVLNLMHAKLIKTFITRI